ncbi:S-adenosyl-L-methionine-dependent methyltransferase [Sodiomyces alkalinus F11]|uniref:S-adenosyl-L-methionine-dependent methyltransferase n=1 Tax=Sodiomyces alkalinus (strain CBS 110278 / VKM F-3762 / F11) TaxID=1314773 RepID=A0A3N2Q0L1_SODAK|nr:S-adenosyl-L-methionine-dependent methyltransferase [Sodiomyces alkalinus F11]ROT40282.1 S-adenosyl-L-methionine-dependent methyltransferase [Sodiomyces alkalinus F11]
MTAGTAETSSSSSFDPETYESTHVHSVYEAIAPHFSSTRHKPWPLVADFLASLPPGSVGLDVGCGNGKYLAVNPSLWLMGSDRSANLVSLARENDGRGRRRQRLNEVTVADSLALPYRASSADFAISIAVLHHLSTRSRRRAAVRAILDCLRPGSGEDGRNGEGKAMLYVWALEQGSSRRGWDEDASQDQLVPWVTKAGTGKTHKESDSRKPENDTTWHRYYHLYRKGELEEDVQAVGGVVLHSGYEKDNWWAICTRGLEM